MFEFLPCLDDEALSLRCQGVLKLPRARASELGREAVMICQARGYRAPSGAWVDLTAALARAREGTRSIPPEASLPEARAHHPVTRVQVRQETTLDATRRLVDDGRRPLALNFANGVHAGGGFLYGALAQEESLCRSSGLYLTLEGDPMYAAHAARPRPDSSAWCILSPDVPVFRTDSGETLEAPWLASFLTCAAPVATHVGAERADAMMAERIPRVLDVARATGYDALVLGAWGCGAFSNDPTTVAAHFRRAILEREGAFAEVVFAITDWSRERRFLGPFRDALRG